MNLNDIKDIHTKSDIERKLLCFEYTEKLHAIMMQKGINCLNEWCKEKETDARIKEILSKNTIPYEESCQAYIYITYILPMMATYWGFSFYMDMKNLHNDILHIIKSEHSVSSEEDVSEFCELMKLIVKKKQFMMRTMYSSRLIFTNIYLPAMSFEEIISRIFLIIYILIIIKISFI